MRIPGRVQSSLACPVPGIQKARHNIRDRDTIDQMIATAAGLVGKRLQYRELIS